MRILQLTDSPPEHIPPPLLDCTQIVGGPRYADRSENGRVISVRTPPGDYELDAIVAKLPPEQRPDLLVVRADSSKGSFPRNIGSHQRRTVLLVGDTHHNASPIATFVNYALSEPYDCVILDYTRQHGHFFLEAGLERVYWLPGFNVDRIKIPRVERPDIPLSLAGDIHRIHARRLELVEAMRRAKLPIEIRPGSRSEMRALHARTLVNFNCSLNGDLNLRVLETVASGGFLLTDRLGLESGLDILLEEEREFVAYDSFEDCIEKCRRYLRNPARAAEIAQAGKTAYEARLAPERIGRDFFALVSHGAVRPEFDLKRDRRTNLKPRSDRAALMARICVYEVLQALQRSRERSDVLMAPSVDPHLLSDAADFARVDVAADVCGALPSSNSTEAFLHRASIHQQVRLIRDIQGIENTRWDAVVTTREDWQSRAYDLIFARNPRAVLIMSDHYKDQEATTAELEAAGFKRLTERAPIFTR